MFSRRFACFLSSASSAREKTKGDEFVSRLLQRSDMQMGCESFGVLRRENLEFEFQNSVAKFCLL